jgi:hypothetical protein
MLESARHWAAQATLGAALVLSLGTPARGAPSDPVDSGRAGRPEYAAPWVPTDSEYQPRVVTRWGNDQFYGSGGDDLGFTQDLTLEAHWLRATDDLSLRARQRLIIERVDSTNKLRTDELTFELGWLTERIWGPFRWSFGPSFALALSGNYGGAKLQNAWHHLIGNGYTFENGLANDYAPYRSGVVFGGRGGPSWLVIPGVRVLAGVDLRGALGETGRSLVGFYDALEVESGKEQFRLLLSGGIDYEHSWSNDPALSMSGGYETSRFNATSHLRAAARGPVWEVGLRAETNVGGSDGNLGMLYVLIGGGYAFRDEHATRQ